MKRFTLILGLAALCAACCAIPLAFAGDAGPAQIGKAAPQFRVLDAENHERRLSDFHGKVVVLEWTSPSCPFSRAQYESGVMPELQRMARKRGMVWLTVLSTHPSRRDYLAAEKAASFHRTRGGISTLLLDADGTMGKAYGAVVTPHMFIIGPDGVLAYAGGPGDNATMDPKEVRSSRNFVREALQDLAAKQKVATPASPPFGCAIAYRG